MVNWEVWCQRFILWIANDVQEFWVPYRDEIPVICRYPLVCCFCFTLGSVFVNKVVRRRKKDRRNNPGGLVVNGSPTKEPSSAVKSLPSGLGEPVAVILASPQSSSSAATTAAAPCSSHPALGSEVPGVSMVMSSKVPPSSHLHSPISSASGAMTSSLARRSSNEVALSVRISGLQRRSWSSTLLFSASKTFDATAVVISVISSTPLALGDCGEVSRRWAQSMSVFLC